MPTANYSYPASGGYKLETSGASGGGLGSSLDDMAAFAREMAMRRMAEHEQDRSRRMNYEDGVMASAAHPLAGPAGNGDEQRLKSLQVQDAIMTLQQKHQMAPQRLVTGAQIIPGMVDDPSAMSAAQRQLYLPQGSSMTGGPTGSEHAAGERYSDETDLDSAARLLAAKSRAAGGLSGRPGADYPGSSLGGR